MTQTRSRKLLARWIVGLGLIILVILAAYLFQARSSRVSNYQECVDAGYPVMESYPDQCSDGNATFVRDITDEYQPRDTDEDGNIKTIQGTITRIEPDCSPSLVLESNGRVIEEGPSLCDAGSFVVIDGIKIQTASGFVEEEDAFSNDISGLYPGDNATATYSVSTADSGTLDCDQCSITKL